MRSPPRSTTSSRAARPASWRTKPLSAQSLRNVVLTAPYMHDGSIATLPDVVRHYAAGGRVIEEGPNVGDGRVSPLKSGLVRGFQITDEEVADVVAFLESLTDTGFVENPAFSDPFVSP